MSTRMWNIITTGRFSLTSRLHTMLYVVQLMGFTWMHSDHLGQDSWKGHFTDKDHVKNQPHQIILNVDLTALKFNSLLTIDSFEIQSNRERRFDKHTIGYGAIPWRNKSVKGAGLIKGWPEWGPQSWTEHAVHSQENSPVTTTLK